MDYDFIHLKYYELYNYEPYHSEDRLCNIDFTTWVDQAKMSCDDYSTAKWCTSNGQYGKGWNRNWKPIEHPEWKVDDMTGWNCPQCGCTGLTKF